MEKFTYFWRGPFSQWHKSYFKDNDGITYNCAEQYMMYKKAELFGDIESMKKILETTSPREHQRIGRKVKGYDEDTWAMNRGKIVFAGNLYKYHYSQDLKKLLFATEGTTLVEASPMDKIWGIGMDENNPRVKSRWSWNGQNLLGEILTRVRDNLLTRERIK